MSEERRFEVQSEERVLERLYESEMRINSAEGWLCTKWLGKKCRRGSMQDPMSREVLRCGASLENSVCVQRVVRIAA